MRKLQVGIAVFAALMILVLAQPRPAAAFGLGFKIFGGYNSLNGGDINEGLKGMVDGQTAMLQVMGGTAQGDYAPFHGGLDVGGDLILYFAPFFGLSVGASYITAQSTTELSGTYPFPGTFNATITPQVKAIPVRGGVYFSIPMGSLVNLTLNGGAEYYLAKIRLQVQTLRQPGSERIETDMNVESKGKVGFYAGLGLEIRLHPNLSLLLEGRGRYAQVDAFEGSQFERETGSPDITFEGDLWYARIDFGALGDFSLIVLSDTPPPADPDILESRKARLAFDGFAAIGGIMIRF